MSRLDSTGSFTLGTDHFTWSVKHYAGEFSADTNFRGLTARVCLADAKARELLIEFAPGDYPPKRPVSPQSIEIRIKANTQQAIDAGWRPDSRGKPFRWEAAPLRA